MSAGHGVDPRALERVGSIVGRMRRQVRLSLQACAHCALCAESCFMYRENGRDPTWTPSYKAINSIGRIARTRGELPPAAWGEIRTLAFDRCVLCMRCRCPVGIRIPSLIAAARAACREAGFPRSYDERRNA
jgi:Fe-S oxidoreductase